MAVELTCPGVGSYGRGLNEQFVHADGCCAAFTLMTDERRAEIGLAWPAAAPRETPRPYEVPVITVDQLINVVKDLQRRATTDPDEVLPETIVYVEIGPGDDFEQVMELIDYGRAYDLVVGYSRTHRTDSPATGGENITNRKDTA